MRNRGRNPNLPIQAVNPENVVLDRSRPEEFSQPLYDRVNITAAAIQSSIALFSVPIGQSSVLIRGSAAAAVAKTRRDTNMEQGGYIATRAYQIRGLGVAIIHSDRSAATNAADRQLILDGAWLRFTVAGSKTVLETPLSVIPVLNDFSAVSSTVTATTINALTGPKGSSYKMQPQIALEAQTNFAVDLSWDGDIALSNTADLVFIMFAGMRRPT